ACASQSKPSSLYSSPGCTLISPTFSTVSLSGANAKVPDTLIPRITASDFTSYSTRCLSRIRTRAPAPGTVPPSQVAAADHGPLLAERITGGSAARAGEDSKHSERRAARRMVEGSGGKVRIGREEHGGLDGAPGRGTASQHIISAWP